MNERELPMLAGIAAIFHWFEELLNILNGPILLFGAGIALVDLLTDGALTATAILFLYAWAISQALGIDTQLLGCFARARRTQGWGRAGWLVLGLVLSFAAWQAGYVFAVQQSQHISEAAALAQLDMSPQVWLGWRAFLAVGLVALSGWTRYVAPAQASIGDERAKLERELELEPLRAAVRARKAVGWRGTMEALRGAPTPATPDGVANDDQNITKSITPDDQPDARPPDVPPPSDGPANSDPPESEREADAEPSHYVPSLRLMPGHAVGERKARGKLSRNDSLRTQAFALLDATPGMTRDALRKALRVRRETASSLYAQWTHTQRKVARS